MNRSFTDRPPGEPTLIAAVLRPRFGRSRPDYGLPPNIGFGDRGSQRGSNTAGRFRKT
jgi:hypothetical protein